MGVTVRTVHRTTIIAKCPHGPDDIYEAEFAVVDRLLTCESIRDAIDRLTVNAVYQESLTQALSESLDCEVVTRGCHGRFNSECRATPTEEME